MNSNGLVALRQPCRQSLSTSTFNSSSAMTSSPTLEIINGHCAERQTQETVIKARNAREEKAKKSNSCSANLPILQNKIAAPPNTRPTTSMRPSALRPPPHRTAGKV
jgi:hypothetical protein